MSRVIVDKWVAHLRCVARPGAGQAPPTGPGPIAQPFGLVVGDDQGGTDTAPHPPPVADVGLWWALAGARLDVDALLSGSTGGPLWPQGRFKTIEVWTEAELCGLHALWRLARDRRRDDWATRVEVVRDWHVQNTQPDNATNRPWALHVFLLADTPECRHYAETLLHNCLVTTGQPEPLSAWILLDAANELERSHPTARPPED